MIDEQTGETLSPSEIEQIKEKLSNMPTRRLVETVLAALGKMDKEEQLSFVARHIDAGVILAHFGEDEPDEFLDKVEEFCKCCLEGDYHSSEYDIEAYFSQMEEYYSDYSDNWDYDEYYAHTEWVEIFQKLFEMTKMYIQSGDVETGCEAGARLLSCLNELEADKDFLGTNEPRMYILINWGEYFAAYYSALFGYYEPEKAVKLAIRYRRDFGKVCTEGFLNNVRDVELAEDYILAEIRREGDWELQRQWFELLTQLYVRLDVQFDKASKARELIARNKYFYLFLIEGLYEREDWRLAVETAIIALSQIPIDGLDSEARRTKLTRSEIRAHIHKMLAGAYEKLGDFTQAFGIAQNMFFESPSFTHYKYARELAGKGADVPTFFAFAEGNAKIKSNVNMYGSTPGLLQAIYSYEGKTKNLLDMVSLGKASQNYYERKYVALSLIYRALSDEDGLGAKLAEYLESNSSQDGVNDMLKYDISPKQQAELLLNAADLLRGIIEFHIEAANRSRYAKAAYYMCVLRDIFSFLDLNEEFNEYYDDVMEVNRRRPALRDEMRIV
ncbi:MAG: hypothetical protein LBL49_04785 [Clostridiales Family XIII bacterium]|jgi:hypothetical protein|nr:hypothetical protein [Clostridiales Family XIII bacterium]